MSDAFNQGLATCSIAEQGGKQVASVVYLVALAGMEQRVPKKDCEIQG